MANSSITGRAGRKTSSYRPWEGGQLIPLNRAGWQAEGPSAVPHKEGEAPPLALDAKGLARVRHGFVEATKRAMRLGRDAIELHCAHGYLLHQFLSPLSNMRTDQDGGTRPNRMRFPLEVVEAIRATFHCDSRSASKCRRLIGSRAAGILHRPLNLPKS